MRYDKISWMMMATKFVRRPSLSSISAPASSTKIRAFLLERGVAVRQGLRFLRAELPRILAAPPEVLSPRMVCLIEGWPRTGAGSMSGSIAYPARSPLLPARTLARMAGEHSGHRADDLAGAGVATKFTFPVHFPHAAARLRVQARQTTTTVAGGAVSRSRF
jgi:hypothetical protein